jgi:uncharacterized membrane protein (UPF0127 family)
MISVQAVETNQWRAQQELIYNNSISDSCSMLFIFEQGAELPFRIHKKHPLFDIIFIAPNNKVVIIQKNVPSSSLEIKPAENDVLYKYVLIVNAGFCETYSVKSDDSISFIQYK